MLTVDGGNIHANEDTQSNRKSKCPNASSSSGWLGERKQNIPLKASRAPQGLAPAFGTHFEDKNKERKKEKKEGRRETGGDLHCVFVCLQLDISITEVYLSLPLSLVSLGGSVSNLIDDHHL